MAVLDLLKPLTMSGLNAKSSRLEQDLKKAISDQTQLREHIANLETDIKKARVEALLEGTDAAKRQADALGPRISKLREQDAALSGQIEITHLALDQLRSDRATAARHEIEAKFETECQELFNLAKSMEPLIASLSEKAQEAERRASALQSISLPHTHGIMSAGTPICNDSWHTALAACLKYSLKDGLRDQLLSVGEHAAREAGQVSGSLGAFVKARFLIEMARLHRGLEAKRSPEELAIDERGLQPNEDD